MIVEDYYAMIKHYFEKDFVHTTFFYCVMEMTTIRGLDLSSQLFAETRHENEMVRRVHLIQKGLFTTNDK